MKFKCLHFAGMSFFRNFNLAPYTVTPAQGPDGKLFMFFGSIPQELTLYGPAPVVTFTPTIVWISIPDQEEYSIALTPKGISNNVLVSPTNSPNRRRRPSKKATPAATAKTARNSQVSRKRALDAYQNQLVARPTIPISNQFTALRKVAKNSATYQLCQAWEVPNPVPRPAHTKASLHRQRKSQAPTEAIYRAHRALKQKKSPRSARLRQYVSRSGQSQDMTQPQAIVSYHNQSQDMARSQAIVPAPGPRKITPKAAPSIQ
jgi:hypothetical protein